MSIDYSHVASCIVATGVNDSLTVIHIPLRGENTRLSTFVLPILFFLDIKDSGSNTNIDKNATCQSIFCQCRKFAQIKH